jgi:hypothetical protein
MIIVVIGRPPQCGSVLPRLMVCGVGLSGSRFLFTPHIIASGCGEAR